jgi:phage terminase large subunit-like protein
LKPLSALQAEHTRRERRKIDRFYPDDGPLRRELYVKHQEFFAAGVAHSERLAICGNRVGKSEGLGAYETSVHATGRYPAWWIGRRFDHPIRAWVAGKTAETTRDILQGKLLGEFKRTPGTPATQAVGLGTGMIPGDAIVSTTPKSGGIANAIDTIWVRHVSGGISTIGFKSYGKDRDSFEGVERDWIWLDEEPPKEVYDECLMRTMSTVPGHSSGSMVITFTPIEGDTEIVRTFLENDGADPDKYFIQITWADAPHITEAEIEKMSRKYLPSQLRARSLGEPALGEGAIYPIDVEQLLVDDIIIPKHWPRAWGLDVGKTAVIWGAKNPDTDVLYLYREYYSEEYNVLLHATAIKGIHGDDAWIPGVADPAAAQSSQIDGQKIIELYRDHGLDVIEAGHKLVESGISEVWERMVTGRFKVFRSLTGWCSEFSRYHRRKKETELGMQSKIVKKYDHRLDATRYLVTDGLDRMIIKPIPVEPRRAPGGSRVWS